MRKAISIAILIAFISASVQSPAYAQAASVDQMPFMPQPGVMVPLSPEYTPAYLKGIVIHPENALKFDFIIYKGDKPLTDAQKREEYTKLTKYFLASLAIPDDDQWVNLSPYEKDRIIKDDFGKTAMGRDLLAQDYLLKQITASLIYPEDNLGKKFWDKVYTQAQKQYGTTNIPVNTFNKVWILPDDALIYEKGNGSTSSPLTAYVLKNHLRVMLEEDYLSLQKHSAINRHSEERSDEESKGALRSFVPMKSIGTQDDKTHALASKIIKEIVLPELQKEVNEDANFAPLRQVYSGMLLATWFKRTLKQSLLGQIYANKAKTKGVEYTSTLIPVSSTVIPAKAGIQPKDDIEVIYHQYLQAYKKGVFNFIKEDTNRLTNETMPRKYFSGGLQGYVASGSVRITYDSAMGKAQELKDMPDDDMAQIALVENGVVGINDAAMKRQEEVSREPLEQIVEKLINSAGASVSKAEKFLKNPSLYRVGYSSQQSFYVSSNPDIVAHENIQFNRYLEIATKGLDATGKSDAKKGLDMLLSRAINAASPFTLRELEEIVYHYIKIVSGNDNPLLEFKRQAYQLAFSQLKEFDRLLKESDGKQRFREAVLIATKGNKFGSAFFADLMDKNQTQQQHFFEIEANHLLNDPVELKEDSRNGLWDDLSGQRKSVVYIVDNVLEDVYDLAFLRELIKAGHKVTVVAKSAEADNDTTKEDFQWLMEQKQVKDFFGNATPHIKVMAGGSATRSTNLRQVTQEFVEAMDEADVIIAKGEGNRGGLETPAGFTKPFYSLMFAKSTHESHGVEIGTAIISRIEPANESTTVPDWAMRGEEDKVMTDTFQHIQKAQDYLNHNLKISHTGDQAQIVFRMPEGLNKRVRDNLMVFLESEGVTSLRIVNREIGFNVTVSQKDVITDLAMLSFFNSNLSRLTKGKIIGWIAGGIFALGILNDRLFDIILGIGMAIFYTDHIVAKYRDGGKDLRKALDELKKGFFTQLTTGKIFGFTGGALFTHGTINSAHVDSRFLIETTLGLALVILTSQKVVDAVRKVYKRDDKNPDAAMMSNLSTKAIRMQMRDLENQILQASTSTDRWNDTVQALMARLRILEDELRTRPDAPTPEEEKAAYAIYHLYHGDDFQAIRAVNSLIAFSQGHINSIPEQYEQILKAYALLDKDGNVPELVKKEAKEIFTDDAAMRGKGPEAKKDGAMNTPIHDEIEALAHNIYLLRGGDAVRNWLDAEWILKLLGARETLDSTPDLLEAMLGFKGATIQEFPHTNYRIVSFDIGNPGKISRILRKVINKVLSEKFGHGEQIVQSKGAGNILLFFTKFSKFEIRQRLVLDAAMRGEREENKKEFENWGEIGGVFLFDYPSNGQRRYVFLGGNPSIVRKEFEQLSHVPEDMLPEPFVYAKDGHLERNKRIRNILAKNDFKAVRVYVKGEDGKIRQVEENEDEKRVLAAAEYNFFDYVDLLLEAFQAHYLALSYSAVDGKIYMQGDNDSRFVIDRNYDRISFLRRDEVFTRLNYEPQESDIYFGRVHVPGMFGQKSIILKDGKVLVEFTDNDEGRVQIYRQGQNIMVEEAGKPTQKLLAGVEHRIRIELPGDYAASIFGLEILRSKNDPDRLGIVSHATFGLNITYMKPNEAMIADKALKAKHREDLGGIDLNSANLNLHIKRDGNGVPLPLAQQDLAQLSNIEGLDPIILSIKPASQTALFSQLIGQP